MNKYLSIIVVSTLVLFSCQEISQDPRQLFATEKLPKILNEIANPKFSPEQTAKILARTNPSGIRVGVIDNGVDYFHPSLIHNIAFKVEDGQIVGAGLDVMGQDNWAHPSRVDPTLFAFGAKKVDGDGRIIGELEDPLAHIIKINDEFVAAVVTEIKKDPVLKNSLFAKLNEDNFTLWDILSKIDGVKKYGDRSESIFGFKSSDYEKKVEEKTLYSNEVTASGHLAYESRFEDNPAKKFDFLKTIHRPWILDSSGKSNAIEWSLGNLEHQDRFYPLLERVYKEFNGRYKIEENLNTLTKFMKRSSDGSKGYSEALELFGSSIIKGKYPGYLSNPMISLLGDLSALVKMEHLDELYGEKATPEGRMRTLSALVDQSNDYGRRFLEANLADEYLSSDKRSKYQEVLNKMKERSDEVKNYWPITRIWLNCTSAKILA